MHISYATNRIVISASKKRYSLNRKQRIGSLHVVRINSEYISSESEYYSKWYLRSPKLFIRKTNKYLWYGISKVRAEQKRKYCRLGIGRLRLRGNTIRIYLL
jgi:hypothetical protein